MLTALLTRGFDWQLPPLPEDAPARARELSTKGISALREGRYEEALACFITLGKLKDVEGANYCSKLGMAYAWKAQREFSKAIQAFKEALGLGFGGPFFDGLITFFIGGTLYDMGLYAEALDAFDKFKELWPEDPDVWVMRNLALIALGEYREGLQSAEQAFPLRHKSSDRGCLLYQGAACVSIAMGLSALKRRWLPDLETATKAFIKWRDRARRDKQTAAFKQAVEEFRGRLTEEEDVTAFEEFMLGVRLMSIRNPFKAWKALGKEISKDWPKDVSAIEAIREQRRW